MITRVAYPETRVVLRALTLLAITALFANAFFFTWENAIPMVKSDGWRFIHKYLIPWYGNTFDWRDLWSDHHPQPVTGLLFIANAKLLDLRMDYEAALGLMFSLPLILLLSRHIHSLRLPHDRPVPRDVLILLTVAIILSLTSTGVYTWSLVTLGFIHTMLAVYILMRLNTLAQNDNGIVSFTITSCVLAAFIVLFGTLAKLYIYAALLICLLAFALERRKNWLYPPAAIFAGISISVITNRLIGSHSSYTETTLFSTLVDNIRYAHEYILYIGVGLSSAWANLALLSRKFNLGETGIIAMGCTVLLIYASTLYMIIKHKIYKITFLPPAFIFVALISALGAAIYRFDPSTQTPISANVPRYYLVYAVGLIGILWAWFIYLRTETRPNSVKNIVIILYCIVAISQIVSTRAAWKQSPSIKKVIVTTTEIMTRNSNGDLSVRPPAFIVNKHYPDTYLSALEFMKENQLNIFSSGYHTDKNRQ